MGSNRVGHVGRLALGWLAAAKEGRGGRDERLELRSLGFGERFDEIQHVGCFAL